MTIYYGRESGVGHYFYCPARMSFALIVQIHKQNIAEKTQDGGDSYNCTED